MLCKKVVTLQCKRKRKGQFAPCAAPSAPDALIFQIFKIMKKLNEKAATRGNESGKAVKMSNSDKVKNEEKANSMSVQKDARGGFEYFKRETAAQLDNLKRERLAEVKAEILQAIEQAETTKAANLLRSCSANDEEEKEITQSALQSACEFSPEFSEVVEKAKEETNGFSLAFVNVENTGSADTLEKVGKEGTLFYIGGHAWGKVSTNSTARSLGSYLTFSEWQKDLAKAKTAKKRSELDVKAAAVVAACKAAPEEQRETILSALVFAYGESAVNVARQRLALSAKVDEARASLLKKD